MSQNYEITLPGNTTSVERPEVTSYDSGNEYSVEHWVDVQLLVKESSEEETTAITEPRLGP